MASLPVTPKLSRSLPHLCEGLTASGSRMSSLLYRMGVVSVPPAADTDSNKYFSSPEVEQPRQNDL